MFIAALSSSNNVNYFKRNYTTIYVNSTCLEHLSIKIHIKYILTIQDWDKLLISAESLHLNVQTTQTHPTLFMTTFI